MNKIFDHENKIFDHENKIFDHEKEEDDELSTSYTLYNHPLGVGCLHEAFTRR
jgi:hypothetical protein